MITSRNLAIAVSAAFVLLVVGIVVWQVVLSPGADDREPESSSPIDLVDDSVATQDSRPTPEESPSTPSPSTPAPSTPYPTTPIASIPEPSNAAPSLEVLEISGVRSRSTVSAFHDGVDQGAEVPVRLRAYDEDGNLDYLQLLTEGGQVLDQGDCEFSMREECTLELAVTASQGYSSTM